MLVDFELRRITRHWALWGHEPYEYEGDFDYGDYELKAEPEYPWYSVAYHICDNGGEGDVADWDLMPDPDPVDAHPEVFAEILTESVVDQHQEAIRRAMGK